MGKNEFLHTLVKMEHQWTDAEIIQRIKHYRLHKDKNIPTDLQREWKKLIAAGTLSSRRRHTQRRSHRRPHRRHARRFKLKKKHIRRYSRKAK